MKLLMTLFLFLISSSELWASGPDCFPGQIEYTKNMDVTDHGLFRGRFMCKTLYWDHGHSYFTGVAQGPLYYQELETSDNLNSCQSIEDLSRVRWTEFKEYGLPVTIDVHFLNKAKLDSNCQPAEVVGFACSFSFKFKDSQLVFKSKVFDVEINSQFGKCWEILNTMVIRKQ